MYHTLSSGVRETGPEEKGKSPGWRLGRVKPRAEADALWVGALACRHATAQARLKMLANQCQGCRQQQRDAEEAYPNDPEQKNLSGILRTIISIECWNCLKMFLRYLTKKLPCIPKPWTKEFVWESVRLSHVGTTTMVSSNKQSFCSTLQTCNGEARSWACRPTARDGSEPSPPPHQGTHCV